MKRINYREEINLLNKMYDKISGSYDERYDGNQFDEIEKYLFSFTNQPKVLEIGCGTGKWLSGFREFAVGLDLSSEMLSEAKRKNIQNLILANGKNLPFKQSSFDLVYLVNSFHFFEDKQKVILEIKNVLKQKGRTIIIFADFFHPRYYWYLYDIAPEIKEYDIKRYSTSDEIKDLFLSAGFSDIEYSTISENKKTFIGDEVFSDPFIKKHNSSQLANLTNDEYFQKIAKIKELADSGFRFRTDIIFSVITAVFR